MQRYLALLVVGAMLTAACGGDATDAEQGEATSSTISQSETATTEDETSASSSVDDLDLGEDGELSLDDFIPGAWSGPTDEADMRAQEMAIQQQIAECMAAEGFEYIPFVPADVGGGFGFEEEDQGEWVKKYGFGVSTWVLMEEEYGYDEESDPWADDPNIPIMEAMDDLEREEYERLLYGGEPEIIQETPWEEIEAMTPEEQEEFFDEAYRDWVPDGCMNRAYEEAYGGGEADMAFWEEFGDDFEDHWTRAEADPRIVEAQAKWSACMAERGHDFANQEAMYSYFFGTEVGGEWVEGEFSMKFNELISWPGDEFGEGEFGGITTAPEFEEGDEGEEFEEGEWEYQGPEYDIELLQPLIDEEISVAVADWECSQHLNDLFETVYKELEQQFLEENLERLIAFKEEYS